MLGHHPNIVRVRGVAALLDVPSLHAHWLDYMARTAELGPRLVIPTDAAAKFLPTLLNMGFQALTEATEGVAPYSCAAVRRKVGVIDSAEIVDGKILVGGWVWGMDFPDLVNEIRKGGLGLCLQIRPGNINPVEKLDEKTVRLREFAFTGCNIMRKESCGFAETGIRLSEAAK